MTSMIGKKLAMRFNANNIDQIFRGPEDASERCNKTVLLTANGKSVRALQHSDGYNFRGFDLLKKKTLIRKFPIWDMQLTAPPTGFINTKTGINYVRRLPYRQWKIGLSENNIQIDYYDDNPNKKRFDYLLTETDLAAAMLGKFPKFEVAFKEVKTKYTGRALSLFTALQKNKKSGFVEILNMNQVIGFIDWKDNINLNPIANNPHMKKFLSEKTGVPV
jgi:hypothetical protein